MVNIFNKETGKEKKVNQRAWELMQQWHDAENWEEVGSGKKIKELPAEVKAVIEGKKTTKKADKKAETKETVKTKENTENSETEKNAPAENLEQDKAVINDPNQL